MEPETLCIGTTLRRGDLRKNTKGQWRTISRRMEGTKVQIAGKYMSREVMEASAEPVYLVELPPDYRFLRRGEKRQDGDEIFMGGEWIPVASGLVGKTTMRIVYPMRRKKPDAKEAVDHARTYAVSTSMDTLELGKAVETLEKASPSLPDPGEGYRLLMEGEWMPPGYAFLSDLGLETWIYGHVCPRTVKYVRRIHGTCRILASVPAIFPDMDVPDPGEGYRLLESSEWVEEGDGFEDPPLGWSQTQIAGKPQCPGRFYRRKARAPLQEAPGPIGTRERLPGCSVSPASVLSGLPDPQTPKPFTPNKYTRYIPTLDGRCVPVDVYCVSEAFPLANCLKSQGAVDAVNHARKKLLAPGQRGTKSSIQDVKEAHASLGRAIEIEEAALGREGKEA